MSITLTLAGREFAAVRNPLTLQSGSIFSPKGKKTTSMSGLINLKANADGAYMVPTNNKLVLLGGICPLVAGLYSPLIVGYADTAMVIGSGDPANLVNPVYAGGDGIIGQYASICVLNQSGEFTIDLEIPASKYPFVMNSGVGDAHIPGIQLIGIVQAVGASRLY